MPREYTMGELAREDRYGRDELLPPPRNPFAPPEAVAQAVRSGIKAADYYLGAPAVAVRGPDIGKYDPGSEEAEFLRQLHGKREQDWAQSTALGLVADPIALWGVKPGVPGTTLGAQIMRPPRMGDVAAPAGIRAYHSSPHDFERFDLSKIGTGEGAQVYGHGIYFAENPAVSGQGGEYWKQFLSRFEGTPEGHAARRLMGEKWDRTRAAAAAQRDAADWEAILANARPDQLKYFREMRDLRNKETELLASGKPVGPRTYEVNIKAKPEEFLNYDVPIKEQSPAVKDALGSYLGGAYLESPNIFPNSLIPTGPVGSRSLAEAGIPGIRYLDQGSRNLAMLKAEPHEFLDGSKGWRVNGPRGDQTFDTLREANDFIAKQGVGRTSNWVVFDPNRIDILRKYGLAGLSALPAAKAMGDLAAQGEYRQ